MEEGGAEGHQDATTSLILPVIAIVAFLQVRMFLVLYTPAISIAIANKLWLKTFIFFSALEEPLYCLGSIYQV